MCLTFMFLFRIKQIVKKKCIDFLKISNAFHKKKIEKKTISDNLVEENARQVILLSHTLDEYFFASYKVKDMR
jgi:hypothetical protein